MANPELANLRRVRSRCHGKLKQAEAVIAVFQAKLADLEARIRTLAPELDLPVRFCQSNPSLPEASCADSHWTSYARRAGRWRSGICDRRVDGEARAVPAHHEADPNQAAGAHGRARGAGAGPHRGGWEGNAAGVGVGA